MKDIKTYINEGYKKPLEPFVIKDTDGNNVEFEPSRYEILNKAFAWVCKHCVIDKKKFEHERTQYKVDRVLSKTDNYELKSVKFPLDPADNDLVDRNIIKSNTEIQKLINKYKGTLDNDQIIGELIPWDTYHKGHTAYTEIILTKNNILSSFIPDYGFPISNEKIV